MESGVGIISAINFLGNLCVVIITITTFYLTIISNKLSVTSVRESFSRFYGTEILLQVKNRTLHPICINAVTLYYLRGGQVIQRSFRKFDISYVIPQWEISTLSSERYTMVELNDIECFEPILIEFECGTKTIYSYEGNIPVKEKILFLSKAFKAIKKRTYEIATVITRSHNETVLSPEVEYAAAIKTKTGEYSWIYITSYGMMSDDIWGYNALPAEMCKNEKDIEKILTTEFGLEEVHVQRMQK